MRPSVSVANHEGGGVRLNALGVKRHRELLAFIEAFREPKVLIELVEIAAPVDLLKVQVVQRHGTEATLTTLT